MKTRFPFLCVAALGFFMVQSAGAGLSADSSTGRRDIVVTQALFGSGSQVADVTKRVAELLRTEPGGFNARADDLEVDPVPAQAKALAITYDYKGKHCLLVVPSKKHVTYQDFVDNAER